MRTKFKSEAQRQHYESEIAEKYEKLKKNHRELQRKYVLLKKQQRQTEAKRYEFEQQLIKMREWSFKLSYSNNKLRKEIEEIKSEYAEDDYELPWGDI